MFICYILLQMTRPSRYISTPPPTIRCSQMPETSPETPSSTRSPHMGASTSSVPETPVSGSRSSVDSSVATIQSDLPDDGCPYTLYAPGLEWEGRPVMFPQGTTRLLPDSVARDLGRIVKRKREIPNGFRWSWISHTQKMEYFNELRVCITCIVIKFIYFLQILNWFMFMS